MQSYSLSNKIAAVIPDASVEIIDYIAPRERKNIYLNVLSKLKRTGIKSAYEEVKKIQIFKRSLKYLKLSNKYITSSALDELFDYIDSTYDALIIGSDAVFNWKQNGFPSAFIPNYSFHIPVVTYAASVHGLKYYDESSDRINICREAFSKMPLIGVRDLCTEQFVSFCCKDAKIIHCCDPTFLLDFDVLYQIEHRSIDALFSEHNISSTKRYIVTMLQDQEVAKDVYNKYHSSYTVVALFSYTKYSDIFIGNASPIEWSLLLRDASLVFTNFFHGTLLSLIQGTPAMVVDTSHYFDKYEGKLMDLMIRRLGISDLYTKIEDYLIDNSNFYLTADSCLKGKYNSIILQAVERERESFSNWKALFQNIIQC